MEGAYSLPFDRFERYTPCGPPDAAAAGLRPYLEVGCRRFNFVPEAPSFDEATAGVAGVKSALIRHVWVDALARC
jgi:hypothetical protein